MFRGDLFVTIAEIHTLILDVCVCLHENYILFFIVWNSFNRIKMGCSIITMLLKTIR